MRRTRPLFLASRWKRCHKPGKVEKALAAGKGKEMDPPPEPGFRKEPSPVPTLMSAQGDEAPSDSRPPELQNKLVLFKPLSWL